MAEGATLVAAAMAEGIAPSRVRAWMRWGAEAYERDAGPEDHQAPYLNLFLKVMQATGATAVAVQKRLYHDQPQYWLTHHPELRQEWDIQTESGRLLDSSVRDEEPAIVAPVPITADSLRTVLKMLIEAGAALPETTMDTTVDSLPTPIQPPDDEQEVG